MKRFFTSTAVGMIFFLGANIPEFVHDCPGVAIFALQLATFTIGYVLMDIYGRKYWEWKNNE
jgi:hypothetical protein